MWELAAKVGISLVSFCLVTSFSCRCYHPSDFLSKIVVCMTGARKGKGGVGGEKGDLGAHAEFAESRAKMPPFFSLKCLR